MIVRAGRRRGPAAVLLIGLVLPTLSGCSAGLETSYGRTRGASLNGTGTAAALFREAGHNVRTAIRLSDELDAWADVIVRFAPRPGPPPSDEADWYDGWLTREHDRRLIYVPRDYDAQAEYWTSVLEQLPEDAPADQRARGLKLRDEARKWPDHRPDVPKEVASPEDWFAVEVPEPDVATVCTTLGGPWGREIDPARAALTRHETLKVESETVLLAGDDRPLAIEWTRFNDSRVLVVASGVFLLNATLVNPARRPLALRVVDWAGDSPRNVAFVEGSSVLGEEASMPSVFKLLRVPPFGWVAAQMMVLGLAACLARAPRLGRARSEPSAGEDRPVAHPEALGILLARIGQPEQARTIIDAYRQWRRKSAGGTSSATEKMPGD
jgi:hypothetical protein